MRTYISLILLLFFITDVKCQTFISKKQAVEDLDFYNKTLSDVHFNPFLFVEKEVYYSEVEKIKASIADSIETKEFIKSLYRLTSLMEDSHSGPSVFQAGIFSDEYKKEQFFPIHTFIHNNKLYLSPKSAHPSGIESGSEIISINSINVESFLSETQGLIGGIPDYKQEFTTRLLSHFLFISGIKAPFDIQYKDPTGKILQKNNITGLSYVKSLLVTMPGLIEGNSFKIIDGKVGYIDFCNMNGSWEDFGQFVDSAFVSFRNNNIQHLAIDLRNNSGGNSMLGDVLLSSLTEKKYRLMGPKKWKVSQQYKDYLKENGNTNHNYLNFKNDEMWELGDCEPLANNFTSKTKFDGDIYFLTGPFTFSSGNMLAAGVKEYGIAEIIGEPTGENTNDFGEVYSFKLPNSNIVMNTTTSFDIGPECNETISSPVMPDMFIESGLSDLLQGEDKALKYILDKTK